MHVQDVLQHDDIPSIDGPVFEAVSDGPDSFHDPESA